MKTRRDFRPQIIITLQSAKFKTQIITQKKSNLNYPEKMVEENN
jgi:hypothetical protein